MTDQQYTPTWEKVREHYYLGRQQFDDPLYPAGGVTEIVAEFDRWYEAEIAAAEQRGAARGWDEAMTAQIQRLISGDPDAERFQVPANPYRADQMEGDE